MFPHAKLPRSYGQTPAVHLFISTTSVHLPQLASVSRVSYGTVSRHRSSSSSMEVPCIRASSKGPAPSACSACKCHRLCERVQGDRGSGIREEVLRSCQTVPSSSEMSSHFPGKIRQMDLLDECMYPRDQAPSYKSSPMPSPSNLPDSPSSPMADTYTNPKVFDSVLAPMVDGKPSGKDCRIDEGGDRAEEDHLP
jgi:hypothetical protein